MEKRHSPKCLSGRRPNIIPVLLVCACNMINEMLLMKCFCCMHSSRVLISSSTAIQHLFYSSAADISEYSEQAADPPAPGSPTNWWHRYSLHHGAWVTALGACMAGARAGGGNGTDISCRAVFTCNLLVVTMCTHCAFAICL